MNKLTLNIVPENIKYYYLIADTHFDHSNIIRFCRRPFSSKSEMNDIMLSNLQELKPCDTLIHLGDVAMGDALYWLTRIRAKVILIRGNHDKAGYDCADISVGGLRLHLIHDPSNLNGSKFDWLIHGHWHNYKPLLNKKNKSMCVSAENIDFKPIQLAKILEIIGEVSKNDNKSRR